MKQTFIATTNNLGASTGLCGAPIVPGISSQTQELLRHIGNLERELGVLRSTLFAEGEVEANRPEPSSLAGMLSEACTRVASLVGEAATINSRLA